MSDHEISAGSVDGYGRQICPVCGGGMDGGSCMGHAIGPEDFGGEDTPHAPSVGKNRCSGCGFFIGHDLNCPRMAAKLKEHLQQAELEEERLRRGGPFADGEVAGRSLQEIIDIELVAKARLKAAVEGGHAGVKYDMGKTRLELVPPEMLDAIGKALTYGAIKYADHNWALGMPWSKMYGACLRHLNRWNAGHEIDDQVSPTGDPPSHLPHLYLAAAELAMLIGSIERGVGVDNRWRKK